NQCEFHWQLVNFTGINEVATGYRKVSEGKAKVNSILPGESGKIIISLPDGWKEADALQLIVYDRHNQEIDSWGWPIAKREKLIKDFMVSSKNKILQSPKDSMFFTIGGTSIKFDEHTGSLETVEVNGIILPIKNFPYIVAESDQDTVTGKRSEGKVNIRRENDNYVLSCTDCNGFKTYTWTLFETGTLQLDYTFELPSGKYHYAGIGMEILSDEIKSKKWLGEGPYRAWKNRPEGGFLNVWAVDKKPNVPGEEWNLPEFEGNFSDWYWADINLQNHMKFSLARGETDLYLGVLNPLNGIDPKRAVWHYPSKEGLYFFNHISSVGSKWKDPSDFGPLAQPSDISGTLKGSVLLNFSWNQQGIETDENRLHIE
ncbi:MAG: hypothetical protein PF450_15865, partial [Bacteroidales bacterium]|nr:hypothetical protein [Bacteroidales bacterium]